MLRAQVARVCELVQLYTNAVTIRQGMSATPSQNFDFQLRRVRRPFSNIKIAYELTIKPFLVALRMGLEAQAPHTRLLPESLAWGHELCPRYT